jgi:signal transduction histidine kinase
MLSPGGFGAVDWGSSETLGGARLANLAIAVIAAFGLLYLTLGRAALRRTTLECAEPPLPRDHVFLVLWILLLGVATAVNPSFATMQFFAYPMAWSILERYRDAVLASAGLSVMVAGGSLVSYVRLGLPYALWLALGVGVVSFVFAVAMGTWITRIYDRGEAQRQLAEKLQATQHEVAVLSAEAGASAERERLSRELHDTLTQTLTGLVMLSEQAERALAAGDQRAARDRLSRVQAAARESLGEARALVATTQPLGDGGLESAIQRVADRMRADTDLRVTCALETVVLDRERQVMLLRAAQEGLANARKHAHASEVAISLAVVGAETSAGTGDEAGDGVDQDAAVVLRVDDNGIGVESERIATGGFGLTGLADRIRGVGGQVYVGPGALGGARLEVRLPLGAAGSRTEGRIS